jgi:hypothetical protein
VDYPVYEIQINEDLSDASGVGFMSIVDRPAIETNFLVFSKELKYAVNDEKRVITGPAIIADKPIYREIAGEKCYTVFTKDVTEKIVKKWAALQNYSLVNTQHQIPVEGVNLFESYLINRERGINPPNEFQDIADGSWFVSYYVTNDEVWNQIKSGEFMGFSIEIDAKVESQEFTELKELLNQLKQINEQL